MVTTMVDNKQFKGIIDSQRRKLESYESEIDRLESIISNLTEELNEADSKFLELRKAYKALKKSIEK